MKCAFPITTRKLFFSDFKDAIFQSMNNEKNSFCSHNHFLHLLELVAIMIREHCSMYVEIYIAPQRANTLNRKTGKRWEKN